MNSTQNGVGAERLNKGRQLKFDGRPASRFDKPSTLKLGMQVLSRVTDEYSIPVQVLYIVSVLLGSIYGRYIDFWRPYMDITDYVHTHLRKSKIGDKCLPLWEICRPSRDKAFSDSRILIPRLSRPV